MKDVCSSCKKQATNLKGAARFACPKCEKFEFIRCSNCRENATTFVCPECGFSGPN